MTDALAGKDKTVGLKQTQRAISQGLARKVFLACDADPQLTQPLLECCEQQGICVDTGWTMRQLGKACGIRVGTAAAALLAET